MGSRPPADRTAAPAGRSRARPGQGIGIGLNYAAHAGEAGFTAPGEPLVFPSSARASRTRRPRLGICMPSGMEDFFRAASWDLSRPRPDEWEITPASMAKAAAAIRQTILGPPLAAHQTIPHAYLTGQQAR